MNPRHDPNAEWLETDGLGGFASGTISGVRTRRYPALLLPATRPPTGRLVLVNGFDGWVCTATGEQAITSQRYTPQVTHPDGMTRIVRFELEPWPRWATAFELGLKSFRERFWNVGRGFLFDVVDVDGQPGVCDPAIRPNQLFAAGGLPCLLLEPEQSRRVLETVEEELWTPLGLRSLARGESGYSPRYEGSVRERDGSYHQGTVWPWLIGPFVEAWVRSRESTKAARRAARERFLQPLHEHLDRAGLGHVSEIADVETPHRPGGCTFQAWSL